MLALQVRGLGALKSRVSMEAKQEAFIWIGCYDTDAVQHNAV